MDNSDQSNWSPGSARHGNFINYYTFHPAENRFRLFPDYSKYLKKDKKNIICLDVGCNTGELTQELHKHVVKRKKTEDSAVSSCHILAVDLDEDLVERAKTANQNDLISYFCVDVLTNDFKEIYKHYLKEHNQESFDIVYCFSVTMWIHLNHGDEGLKQFIIRLGDIADLLIIEPQPWKCYGRAVRRMKRADVEPFEEFKNLKVRKDIESYIDSLLIDKCKFEKVLQTAPTTWGRQISFYKKKQN